MMVFMNLDEKYGRLVKFVSERGADGAVIALSGGVDSSTLAAVCYRVLREKAVAATIKAPIYSSDEIEDAKNSAEKIGISHYFVEANPLLNFDFVRNPESRCYYCKKEMLECLQKFAQSLGFKAIFEGTNFSDLKEDRPGLKAIREKENVFCPWVENKFTKEEIRALAKKLELSVYDKPAMACLATRIPYGEQITQEKLCRIERAERMIKEICGVRQIRVRDHDGLARIEVGRDERHLLFNIENIDRITEKLRNLGFKFVTLDLEGYRAGNMSTMVKTKRDKH